MIRWYDYIAAIGFADVITGMLFSGTIISGIIAYGIFYLWNDLYCPFRKELEENVDN